MLVHPEHRLGQHGTAVLLGRRDSYVISKGATKIAFDQSNVPGTGYIAVGPNAIATAAKVPISDYTDNVPITSADSVAIKLVDAAGPSARWCSTSPRLRRW